MLVKTEKKIKIIRKNFIKHIKKQKIEKLDEFKKKNEKLEKYEKIQNGMTKNEYNKLIDEKKRNPLIILINLYNQWKI